MELSVRLDNYFASHFEGSALTRRMACVTSLVPTDRARGNRIWVWKGGSADEPSRDDHVERRSR